MKKEDYSELKAFINECAKSSINESDVDEGLGWLRNAGKLFRRGASHADDAARVAKGGVSHADDIAKRAARLGQWSQKFETGIAALRKSIAADKAAAEALLKRTNEISAKMASKVGKNGKALNQANFDVMTKQIAENQAKYQKMLQQITQREQKLARHVGTSEKIKKELEALKTLKAETNAVLKTTQQSAKNVDKIRKALGLAAVFGTGALVGSALSGGQEAGAEGAGGAGSAGGAGGAGGAGMQPDERVKRMQHALNAAGYNSGKEDGLLGPITRAAAKEAGIDPDTWDGTPEIKPKQQAANPEQQSGATQDGQAQQGAEQAAQQNTYDYSKSSAYGKYLGGATPEEIQKFQYDFKVQPTGKYDEATAEKAYALANDEADNNFKRAGSTIKAYANYDLHQSGYASGQADLKAQQAREALVAQIEKLKKRLAPIDDRKLDQIISYVDSGNFAAATELAKRVSGGGHTIQPLIAALEAARKPAMNEMKEKFFETLNRINKATILQ